MTPIIYTKSNCPNCERTKEMFNRGGVSYKVVDLDKDKEALNNLVKEGFMSAPVVKAGEYTWAGYNPKKIRKVIDQTMNSSDIWA